MINKIIALLVGAQDELEQLSTKADVEKAKYLNNKQVKKAFYVGLFLGACLGVAFGLNL